MTDYSKFKVLELKDELKARGVPLTGLKLKQQFIDKLVELDAQQSAGAVAEDGEGVTEAELDGTTTTHGGKIEQGGAKGDEDNKAQATPEQSENAAGEENIEPGASIVPKDEALVLDAGTEQADDEGNAPKLDEVQQTEPQLQKDISPTENITVNTLMSGAEQGPISDKAKKATDTIAATPVTESVEREMLVDNKKRKRRSITPPPVSEEVSKKAKALDGSPRPIKADAALTAEDVGAQKERMDAISQETPAPVHPNGEKADQDAPITNEESGTTSGSLSRFTQPEPVGDPEEDDHQTSPALHQATSSLYIRDLKRPLQVSTLRSHLTTLALPPTSSSPPPTDPITNLYLDSIKSHAFASFTSIAAASRVRSKLHDVRWPAEPMRDALWVDFIPDEKVEEWIDTETSSNSLGRGPGLKKWEVVYTSDPSTPTQAILQEVGTPNDTLPSTRPQRPTSPQPPPKRTPPPPKSTAFSALDTLFPSTQKSKPKLYFKPVSSSIAESRLEAFRHLFRVDQVQVGEEMRRYSFETENGREASWVDKGGEWGRRGGPGDRGGFGGGGYGRGRGGGGGRRGGWRSGIGY
ncbi:putative sap domain protein [Phaeomoniella chlamydospora]|uniref:Putative sap domain protein n=1 Tax=Phaeomoniella chlamydospora TaxID=158046 RepID=A0A0G2EKG3_PHACM|nr:putative sap domain protein [Phaeomoniella chlamydospora]